VDVAAPSMLLVIGGAVLIIVMVGVLLWVYMSRDRDPRE
jgi:hypothetical protein